MIHFADLVIAAGAHRRFRQYVLWAAVRTHKTSRGFGYLEPADVRAVARELRISTTTLRRTLGGGCGVFWTRGKAGTIHPYAPARVAAALGVPRFRASFRDSLKALRQHTCRARLAIMAIAAIRRGKPTSLEVMARLLNITARTARRYCGASGLPVRENFLYVADVTPQNARIVPPHASLRIRRLGGRPMFVRQIANSFPDVGHGGRTLLRRHNRRLRAGQPPSTFPGRGNSRLLYDAHRRRPESTPSPLYTLAGVLDRSSRDRRRAAARLWTHTFPATEESLFSSPPVSALRTVKPGKK